MTQEIWLTIEEVCNLTGEVKETVRRKCKRGEYISTFSKNGRLKIYSVKLSSLPKDAQDLYINPKDKLAVELNTIEQNAKEYANAPDWARKQADKYIELINATEDMTHSEIVKFLKTWNENYPDKKSSYPALYRAKKNYKKFGISAILSKKGQRNHAYLKNADYYEYYKSLYLKEGAPSVFSCWQITLGYAKSKPDFNLDTFPSYKTFDRLLKTDVPKQAIYLARYGQAAWNKKYATYISRDYSNLKAGSCWVSDHAQIDVAVNVDGQICFPWVTVFRDIKTSKWLGWLLHSESPNSDHIFQAFYYAATRFGLPNDVYLDNGKDYRCKDFAGGRNNIKVNHSTSKENSLIKNIGVKVHFALPYNAQTKPVERDFLKIKTFLSKHFVGYRGGNVLERPEKLKSEIKKNEIMEYDDFKRIFDDFIINYLNKKTSKGKVLKGKSPDELWAEEFTVKKIISKDALKLFCTRTSSVVSIGRNGIYDSKLKEHYLDEWMICEKGRKVFIRRDIEAYQEAWVFDAVTEEYLGKANLYHPCSFLSNKNIEKAQYMKQIAIKNKEKKIIKSYIKTRYNPSNEDIVDNLKRSIDKKNFNSDVKIAKISNTKMDQVAKIEKSKNKANKSNKKLEDSLISCFSREPTIQEKKETFLKYNKRPIFSSITEKQMYLEKYPEDYEKLCGCS